MIYYKENGTDKDVVFSTRIRLARNLADYPFYSKLDPTSAGEIIEKVTAALGADFIAVDFSALSPSAARAYVEEHFVSPEFISSRLPHVLLTGDDGHTAIMLCEEDHIRLQTFAPGLDLDGAFQRACVLDARLCAALNIAYDEKLGFLTHCPTNLGTGMRASAMLFLPALTATRQITKIAAMLSKVGMTIRGLYGEGSDARGALYQISNQVTLGIREEDVIQNLREIIHRIAEMERGARKDYLDADPDSATDRARRAWGILQWAGKLSSEEFLSLWAQVRLGAALDLLENVDYARLDALLIETMPDVLARRLQDASPAKRDLERARVVQAAL